MKYLSCAVSFTLLLLAAAVYPYGLHHIPGKDATVLKWKDGRIDLRISRSLLTDVPDVRERGETLAAIRRAVSLWNSAAAVEFKIGVTDVESVSPPGRSGDGISVVTIAQTPENLLLFSGRNATAAAFTRVFYDSEGSITEADIVLNPYFTVSTKGIAGSFDLESTVAHELGHAIGLGHSSVLSATMAEEGGRNGVYAIPGPSRARLSADDIAGARALYGAPEGESGCCATVRLAGEFGNKGTFRIWAVDADTGRISASVDSDRLGQLELAGLEAGEYEIFGRDLEDEYSGAVLLKEVSARPGAETEVAIPSAPGRTGFVLKNVGFNGQLSAVAVPLNPGGTYRLYVGGSSLQGELLFSVRSRYFSVDKTTVERVGPGSSMAVISFLVEVSEDAPYGDYPVVVSDKAGRQQWLLGAVTVGKAKNPWSVFQF